MADPRDLKFFPSDMKLVEHLRKRIATGKEGFIKDIKLYEDEPWLLPHVNNDLFNEKEWFYFGKRILKAGKTPIRTVPGRGGSNGGTWKNGSKEVIRDGNKVVIGYKAELSYYKNVKGKTKEEREATGWCMTEYWLASENDAEFQEVVLCYLRGQKKKVRIVSSHSSTNRVFPSLEDIYTMVDPCDLQFIPTDLKVVDHYLRNRVETGKDGFIKDIKIYEDEPWLLPHVHNDQFIENEWFYFAKRTSGRPRKTPQRMVPGRGGSEGGTWMTTGSKEAIFSNGVVIGYKQEVSYYKHVKGQTKGAITATGWCMTEYWLASENDAELQQIFLCNIRVKKNVLDQFKFRTEINNNIVEQPPLDNNMVSNALVTGVGGEGYDSEFSQQNMDHDDYRFMFDTESLDFIYQQPPLMLSQDSIPPLQGQDSRSTMDQDMEYAQELENMLDEEEDQNMEEYVNELENILDEEKEEDDDRAIQKQHPKIQSHDSTSTMDQNMEEYVNDLENMLEEDDDKGIQQQDSQIPLQVQSQDSGTPHLVIMEDECVDQDIIFDLVEQEEKEKMLITSSEIYLAALKRQRNLHSQEPPVTNGVNQDLSWYGVAQEQSRKRRKQC